jgi:hypothetical protein
MNEIKIAIGKVREIENEYSRFVNDDKHATDRPFDGLRVRVELPTDLVGQDEEKLKQLPWSFPLMPKTFQSIPKVGEAVLVFYDGSKEGQRYYIGPIISQPQFNTYAAKDNATSLLITKGTKPLERVSNSPYTNGAFPKQTDVAIIGRGSEDVILRSDTSSTNRNDVVSSEVQLRAGIRTQPLNDPNPNMVGNIIFNGTDPAYIQMKYKKGLSKNAASIINMVANRVNIMSNKDANISHDLGDNKNLIQDDKIDGIMDNLHQVPMGDKLVELLKIIKGCILHHVHPWAGMEQCGDWGGYITQLEGYDIDAILSKYVRIS